MMWHTFDKDMFYPPKDELSLNFFDEFDDTTIKKIHKFIEDAKEIIIPDVYYQPYICNNCGKIESKIYFKMFSVNPNDTFRVLYSCDCGGRYRKISNKEKENLHCSKCGEQMVEDFEKHLFWD